MQERPRRYEDFPPATQRVIDNLTLLGIRVWRREQAEAAVTPFAPVQPIDCTTDCITFGDQCSDNNVASG